jgi:hypothetical protein
MPPLCIPFAFGIPIPIDANTYTSSGGPIWWDTSGPLPGRNTDLEDPRWVGSLRLSSPDVSGVPTDHVFFRALYSNVGADNYLLLSWVVKVDPSVGSSADAVTVGFFQSGMSGSAVGFRVIPVQAAPLNAQLGVAPFEIDVLVGTQGAGGVWAWSESAAPKPAWLNQTKVWVDPSSSPRYPWAVQMRVPIRSAGNPDGVDLGSAFRMRFQVNVSAPGAVTSTYRWPRSAQTVLGDDLGDPTSTSDWDDFSLASGGTCAGGVSVSWGDVSVNSDPGDPAYDPNPNNSNTIKFGGNVSNVFRVTPFNNTGSTIPASTNPNPPGDPTGVLNLSARFRIANWGSQPDGGTGTWADVPGGFDVRNILRAGVANSGDIPQGQKGVMQFNWVVEDVPGGPQFLSDFTANPPLRRAHQCVLAELSGPVTFTRSGVYQNMHFAHASTVTRDADITVAGLGSAGGTHRDVYLFVQTLNMPTSLRPPTASRGRDGAPAPQPPQPPQRPPGEPNLRAAGSGIENGGDGEFEMPPPGPPEPPWQEETRPLMIVHVWHTTGRTVTGTDGVSRAELEPQTSFGFYVSHEGSLFGWSQALSAAGLQQVGPNFYRIRVPNDGTVTVRTHAEALEAPADIETLLAWLLALLRALLRLLFRWLGRLLRRNSP